MEKLFIQSTSYDEEVWKPCPDFEEHYEVSNLGRVRSRSVFIPHDGSWNKDMNGYIKKVKIHNQQVNRYGYLQTKLCKYGKCRQLTIHRLVAKAFIENPENKSQVNHIDGNKKNNRVDNLEWTTRSENVKHAYDTGLMSSKHMTGSNHPLSKLTEDDVREIRTSEKKLKDLAKQFGVSYATIIDIKKHRTWKNII